MVAFRHPWLDRMLFLVCPKAKRKHLDRLDPTRYLGPISQLVFNYNDSVTTEYHLQLRYCI
jgi:hypothetical protein